jgi:hypothetical protein
MKKPFLIILLLTFNIGVSAQTLYRSYTSGNWNSNSTWQMSTNGGGTWISATSTPTSSNGTITIRSPHTVTVTADVTVDQVVIDAGG